MKNGLEFPTIRRWRLLLLSSNTLLITKFEEHHNISRLEKELSNFRGEYNYHMRLDILDQKTPAEIFFCKENFMPRDVEVVTPYEKDGEIRAKFTNRVGKQARMALPHIERASAYRPQETTPHNFT